MSRSHRFLSKTTQDPDTLQCGNAWLGNLTDAECRSNFGLWAIAKAPLIVGSDPRRWTPAQKGIMTNAAVIAVNQDSLGVQV